MDPVPPKRFNIAGPCLPGEHYMLPAVERLPKTRFMAWGGDYFVVHAPSGSGKTTFLRALAAEINAEGRQYALYCSLEALQGCSDPDRGLPLIVQGLNAAVAASPALREKPVERQPAGNMATGILLALSRFSSALDKPLVIFFDEIDRLSGQTWITFLRQVRSGFGIRDTTPFPRTIAFAGLSKIRDYKAQIRPDREALRASPFNIVTESPTLDNFTREQVAELYRQHTEATGQVFEPEAAARAWYWSEGQPWLVNALAKRVVEDDLERDHSLPVTAGHIDAAADALIRRRDAHIGSLMERLREPRVRRVIEPVLTGGEREASFLHDDTGFCLDLGLVKTSAAGALSPANPIYREAMLRTLAHDARALPPESPINRRLDGKSLDPTAILREFQQFWRENAAVWVERCAYREAAPILLLQAFLRRAVNGGAEIPGEMVAGRGRVDLRLQYAGKAYPVELKLADREPLEKTLERTADYMDAQGAREAWLVIFDRNQEKPWEEKLFREDKTLPDGRLVHVVGC
ncbi:MAG: ATP-binding protein [Planctomycetota bacterium]|jgi:DNA polymerase III delta prime subunit|nr:ATP-binding protein [Planctomycetota bacterium]